MTRPPRVAEGNHGPMVNVRFVDLSAYGIRLPEDRVRMVIAQPHLPETAFTPSEPYSLTGHANTRQLEIVTRTLDIACPSPEAPATHFTILPEYCVPGLDGVDLIEERLQADSWTNGTVVIGGLDGVSREDYGQLLDAGHTHHDTERNGVGRLAPDQWVNCSITWVKSKNGSVSRWVQPKLWPAWPEARGENQRMFRGGSIYLFRGQRTHGEQFIFGTLLCFDWIAPSEPSPRERILAAIHSEASGAQLPLTWLFVLQRNDRPSHPDFLHNVVSFFNNRSYPNATRSHTCLIFANTAGLKQPGFCTEYGSTSAILSPACSFMTSGASPTMSHQGFRYREENPVLLKSARCTDVFCRERGECIHVFDQINPSWLLSSASGKSYAVENAEVHAASGLSHVLAPGGTVPAAVKWANDALDQTSTELPAHAPALGELLETAHEAVSHRLRNKCSAALTDIVRLSTPTADDNIDAWSTVELSGLEHVLYTLRILSAGDKLESVGEAMAHGSVAFRSASLDVVAIRGHSHRDCIEHFAKNHRGRQRRHLLLVSRDKENTVWDPKYGSFLTMASSVNESGPRITDGASPTYHVGYQDILGFLREATNLDEVERGIEASAGP